MGRVVWRSPSRHYESDGNTISRRSTIGGDNGVRHIVTLDLHRLTDCEIELINLFRKSGASGKLILMLARAASGELQTSNVVPIRPDIETVSV